MNWLLILAIILIAWNVVKGYSHGILRMIYSLVAWILILVVVSWATPHVCAYLEENTGIQANIQERCRDKLNEIVEQKGEQNSNTEILAAMGVQMPEVVVDKLFGTDNLADGILEKTGLYDVVSDKISQLAMTGISFLLVLVVASIVFGIILQLIKIVEKIPVIHGVNRILGAVGGLLKGIVLIWIMFAIIALTGTSSLGTIATSYIYESEFLQFLYENNIILMILMSFL